METLVWMAVLGGVAWPLIACYRSGKRTGSRLGFNVGVRRGRRRR